MPTSLAPTPESLTTWDLSSRLEWLVTNGIGGYSSSSVSGANTRRYHGILVAAAEPPLGRVVLLSKLEEEIRIEDQLYFLSANKYPSVIYPQGFRHLSRVALEPVLTFLYSLHEHTVMLQKQIWMPHGQNTVFVKYTLLKAPEPIKFALVPYMAYKDYHTEQHRWDGFTARCDSSASGPVIFTAYDGAKPVRFGTGPEHAFTFSQECGWFYNYEHEREQERGLDFTEDLYCPGRFDGVLAPGRTATFYATLETGALADVEDSLKSESARLADLERLAGISDGDRRQEAYHALVTAADQFVIPSSPRVSRATIIAGYHWFTDWGRDTFISLPGLCLTTGRAEVAKEILAAFAGSVQHGLIPNRFDDNNQGAEFNTVDATLWFVYAAHAYAHATGDWAFLSQDLLPTFEQILDAHREGTLYSIHVDHADGLLYAGEAGVQLTWMDAKVGDWVVTPRTGKPVEIQALYYNALLIIADAQERAGKIDDAAKARQEAEQLKASFAAKFVNPGNGVLYDVIDVPGTSEPDASMRPNQILALSLHHPLIDPSSDLAKSIVDKVHSRLYTDSGMRTLDPSDSQYKATYGPGDQTRRDGAYHQGTVWPWLLGPFLEAHLKVHSDRAAAMDLLSPLLRNLTHYGYATINEIADGDFPHAPNGCIAQAWSVAEALRLYKLITEHPHKQ